LLLAGVSLACIFVGGLPLWRGRRRFTREQITCPNCQRTMDKGRRHCPYCKEELVKY
jgi:predicted amidophosphoribosyltransferase